MNELRSITSEETTENMAARVRAFLDDIRRRHGPRVIGQRPCTKLYSHYVADFTRLPQWDAIPKQNCLDDCAKYGRLLPAVWRFPPFRCRSSVAVSPFCRCKILLFWENYVRKFRSVTAVNSKNIRNGSGNGNGNDIRKRQRLTGTATRQRNDGNRASYTVPWSPLTSDVFVD